MNSANVALALERWATEYNEKWEANAIYFGKLEEKEQRAKEAERRRKSNLKHWVILRRANPESPVEETMTDRDLIRWYYDGLFPKRKRGVKG